MLNVVDQEDLRPLLQQLKKGFVYAIEELMSQICIVFSLGIFNGLNGRRERDVAFFLCNLLSQFDGGFQWILFGGDRQSKYR